MNKVLGPSGKDGLPFFQLEGTWFVMLCWFLLYYSVNRLYVYICPLSLSLLAMPPSQPSRSSPGWAPCAYSRSPRATYFTPGNVCMSQLPFQFVPWPSSHSVFTSSLSSSAEWRTSDWQMTWSWHHWMILGIKSSIECNNNRKINTLCNHGCTIRVLMSIKSLCFWSSLVCTRLVSPAHTPATQQTRRRVCSPRTCHKGAAGICLTYLFSLEPKRSLRFQNSYQK